jgi:protein phosphatase
MPTAAGAAAGAAADAAHGRRRSVRRLGVVAGLLAALAVAGAAGAVVYSAVFFIGDDEGRLTIYSGVPAEVGPVKLHAVYRRSVRTYESLSPEERQVVDARALRSRREALDVSERLEMWP